jgi:hypothetical protein
VTSAICGHGTRPPSFSPGLGTLFTRRFNPVAVHAIDMRRPRNVKACLAWEDDLVIQKMFEFMSTYTHPEAWRCIAGGSWAKPDNCRMPEPLRQRLEARRSNAQSKPSVGGAGLSLARQQSIRS